MIQEYKIIDDGIWIPRQELNRYRDEKIEYLKGVGRYPNMSSYAVGQIHLLEELMSRIENRLKC